MQSWEEILDPQAVRTNSVRSADMQRMIDAVDELLTALNAARPVMNQVAWYVSLVERRPYLADELEFGDELADALDTILSVLRHP